MKEECNGECTGACLIGLEGIINTLSKKWTLLIINTLGDHPKLRYNELMHELSTISPKTLSDLLKRLEKENLIKRTAFNEIPPRVEYSLTEEGKELRRAIIPMLEWVSRKYNSDREKCLEPSKAINEQRI